MCIIAVAVELVGYRTLRNSNAVCVSIRQSAFAGGADNYVHLLSGLRTLLLQDSREERTFRVWLQSLLRDQVALRSLSEGLRDGARPGF